MIKRFLPALLMVVLVGCDISSSLLTEEERKSIYSLELANGQLPLASGAALAAGSTLGVKVGTVSGATAPAALKFRLVNAEGVVIAELGYRDAESADLDGEGAVQVASLEGDLPGFALPEDLSPGLYSLESDFLGKSGNTLQSDAFRFFVAPSGFAIGSLSVYPPNPQAGSKGLLMASVEVGGENAWLKWSLEGKTFAEGSLSKDFDRVVWPVPEVGGVYALKVEIYPTPPAEASYDLASPWRQTLALIVSKPRNGPVDPFDKPTRFFSLFGFDGDFLDSGTRAQNEPPSSFGSPRLEAYQGGFGYRLGPEAGLRAPSFFIPDLSSGVGFSVLLRVSIDSTSGSLFDFLDAEGSRAISIGLDEGRLYLESSDGAALTRASTEVELSEGAHDLMLSFVPNASRYTLVWTIDGDRFAAGSIPVAIPAFSELVIGGSGSISGVYDAFGLSLDETEPPPALLASSLGRIYNEDFVYAEGFESSQPAGATLSGNAGRESLGLRLSKESRLLLAPQLSFDGPTLVELRYQEETPSLSLIDENGEEILRLSPAGEVFDASGEVRGSIALSSGTLSLVLRAGASAIDILDEEGLPVVSLPVKSMTPKFQIAIQAEGDVVLNRLLVLRTSEPSVPGD